MRYLVIRVSIAFLLIFGNVKAGKQDSLAYQLHNGKPQPIVKLSSDINALLDNSDFANSMIGVCIQSLETGEYLYKSNDTKNFVPASTLKLLTTAAALDYLGKDFRFTTSFYLDGELEENGVFDGNIIVRGSGDPTMSGYFFSEPAVAIDDFVSKLDSLGIKSISGNIIGDDRYFDRVYYADGWAWDDMSYPFSSQVNSLSIYDNSIEITVQPGDSVGGLAKIKVSPETNYVQIINQVRTVNEKNLTDIEPYREQGTNIIELYGSIIQNPKKNKEAQKLQVTIDNPTIFFLSILKKRLSEHVIRFTGALLEDNEFSGQISYPNLEPVFEHESPPLVEIISVINKVSHNLAADMLLKTIGKESAGEGSFTKGIDQIQKYASKAGINPKNIIIADGSGLSRYNLISPRYMTTLLAAINKSDNREIFMKSLAEPGKPGTLSSRMTNTNADNNIKAKTGSMNGISNLCGYVTTRDGEIFAIAIMINNFTAPSSLAQNLQDLILMRIASFSRKGY